MMEMLSSRLSALAHDQRRAVLRLLVRRFPSEVSAGDIARTLAIKGSTLSMYLATLRQAELIHQRRDSRTLFYRADVDAVAAMVRQLAADCCRGTLDGSGPPQGAVAFDQRPRVLFVCTQNACRSIMAEAILRDEAADRFAAYSAGTRPRFEVHPQTLEFLKGRGHCVDGLYSKGIQMFHAADAPAMQFVLTVCDRAADEDCAPRAGEPVTSHWSMPAIIHTAPGSPGSPGNWDVFEEAYETLRQRIRRFVHGSLDRQTRASWQMLADEAATLTA